MKNYTNSEIKIAKRRAYNFIFDRSRLINRIGHKNFTFDGRTRIGNLSNQIYQKINNIADIKKAKQKVIQRRKNKFTFSNILDSPIVKDFINNTPEKVFKDRLRFNSRNHWAKNETDLKVLKILMKN
jgi:hypothetical protein